MIGHEAFATGQLLQDQLLHQPQTSVNDIISGCLDYRFRGGRKSICGLGVA